MGENNSGRQLKLVCMII